MNRDAGDRQRQAYDVWNKDANNYHFTTSRDGRTWTPGREMPHVPNGANSPTFHEHEGAIWLSVTQGDTDASRKERIMFGKLEDLPTTPGKPVN